MTEKHLLIKGNIDQAQSTLRCSIEKIDHVLSDRDIDDCRVEVFPTLKLWETDQQPNDPADDEYPYKNFAWPGYAEPAKSKSNQDGKGYPDLDHKFSEFSSRHAPWKGVERELIECLECEEERQRGNQCDGNCLQVSIRLPMEDSAKENDPNHNDCCTIYPIQLFNIHNTAQPLV